MNESMSILLATTILALGGLGLYMYKSDNNDDNNDSEYDSNSKYDEEGLFGSTKLTGWWLNDDEDDEDNNRKNKRANKSNDDDYLDEDYLDEDYEEEDFKPRKRSSKTQKNRKTNSSSKRRY